MCIELPPADAESENEDINWNQKTRPKRKCTHRQTIRYVEVTKRAKRPAVPKSIARPSNKAAKTGNQNNGSKPKKIPINDNKNADVKPSNKAAKKFTVNTTNGSKSKKIPINDNKTANVSKMRAKRNVPVISKSVNSKAKKSIRNIKVNIKKNHWINGDFEKTTKFPKPTKDYYYYYSNYFLLTTYGIIFKRKRRSTPFQLIVLIQKLRNRN